MLDVKNNFRNKYNNIICRACGVVEETLTQSHILEECRVIHLQQDTKYENKLKISSKQTPNS